MSDERGEDMMLPRESNGRLRNGLIVRLYGLHRTLHPAGGTTTHAIILSYDLLQHTYEIFDQHGNTAHLPPENLFAMPSAEQGALRRRHFLTGIPAPTTPDWQPTLLQMRDDMAAVQHHLPLSTTVPELQTETLAVTVEFTLVAGQWVMTPMPDRSMHTPDVTPTTSTEAAPNSILYHSTSTPASSSSRWTTAAEQCCFAGCTATRAALTPCAAITRNTYTESLGPRYAQYTRTCPHATCSLHGATTHDGSRTCSCHSRTNNDLLESMNNRYNTLQRNLQRTIRDMNLPRRPEGPPS
jgi:hypothetical protein